MKKCNLFIDGGTTNTRFVLLDGKNEKVIARMERKVGASSTESSDANEKLKLSVKDAIYRLETENGCRIENIYASGMITSNAGLYELPHIDAPAAVENLKNGIEKVYLPEISRDVPFQFFPGIKFQNQPEIGFDMMRGEEVEIYGALEPEDYQKSILFIHFGSHNKLIFVEDGIIRNAITTISGELLWAIVTETILKSSIGNFEEPFTMDPSYIEMGYRETKESSISRSLFVARIHQVINEATHEQVKSYLYGAITFLDLQVFSKLMTKETDKMILYGRENFIKAFRHCMRFVEEGQLEKIPIEEISFEESEKLSVQGIQAILSDCL